MGIGKIQYYVSKCHDRLNGKAYDPESVSEHICVNPYYKVTIQKQVTTKFMIDSGAFQDVKNEKRLSFEKALERQMNFEKTISNIKAESIVSYDRLVDEQFDKNVGQFKKRVDKKLSEEYVEETIRAAEFLSKKRGKVHPRKLILSCQGINIKQYCGCIDHILDFSEPDDIIGFGGFCIISKSKEYENQFYKVIKKTFPIIKSKGITRVHIFGVGVFRPLVQADMYARLNGISCSYDTSSPEINATFGSLFNPTRPGLSNVYSKVHKNNGYDPADIALFNIKMINEFWKNHNKLPIPNGFVPGIIDSRKIKI